MSGTAPAIYHNDHSRPEKPVVRSLEEEISRVVRGRPRNATAMAPMIIPRTFVFRHHAERSGRGPSGSIGEVLATVGLP